MSSVAIITARGGSKRIPKKNIKDFCGKPIIAYSIEAALNAECFDEIMVSTDSREIAETAVRYGAKVPFMRSEKTSNDFAATADVIKEVLEEYEKLGKSFEWLCCIYPTAPFLKGEVLNHSMAEADRLGAESLLPVVRYGYPPKRGFVIQDGYLKYLYPENERVRSQDLEPEYHDAGQFYVCRTDAFRKSGTLVMEHTVPLILKEEDVQDIDTMEDWHMAELKYVYKRYKENFKEENVMNKILTAISGGGSIIEQQSCHS